jgi:hypothetical protein
MILVSGERFRILQLYSKTSQPIIDIEIASKNKVLGISEDNQLFLTF